MAANKVCNTSTINQNIVEPFETKMADRYVKKLSTLLNRNDFNDMSFSTISAKWVFSKQLKSAEIVEERKFFIISALKIAKI